VGTGDPARPTSSRVATAAPGRPPAKSAEEEEREEVEEERDGDNEESDAPSACALGGRVGAAGTVTTRGPGNKDSSPLPKARRFSASFSLTFAVVLSTVTAFDVVIKQSPLVYPFLRIVILSEAKDLLLSAS
jgi:hypothetical protein